MAKRKKKKVSHPVKFSPANYLREKSRGFPIHECWVNSNWQESGMATVIVCRKQPSGKFLIGLYMLDVFCLGVKDTTFFYNLEEYEYEEKLRESYMAQEQPENPIEYPLAHNIIYGAIEYADDLGFKPHKDFRISQYVLEADDEKIELIDLEFGQNGQACYIAGPFDDVRKIIATLNRNVGEGNYTFISPHF